MSKKLLLADDSITIQKVIGITFANEDYELAVVDNGVSALEKARENRPDLVLADVFMPGKNGYELCSAIKQDPALAHVPVLLLTGTFEPFDEDKARQAGADGWIAKPFESQTLIDRVEQLLSAAPAPVVPSAPVAPPPAPEGPVEPAAAATITPRPVEAEPAVSWDEPEVAVAPPAAAGSVPPAEEDIWSSIAFDEEDLQPVAPELEEEFLFEEETYPEVPEPVVPDLPQAPAVPEAGPAGDVVHPPEAGEPDWGDFEEEILALDDSDILEAEEFVADDGEEFIFAVEEAAEPVAGEAPPARDFSFEEEPVAADLPGLDTAFGEEPEPAAAAAAEEWEFPAGEEVAPAAAGPLAAEDWDFDLTREPSPSALPCEPMAPSAPVGSEAEAASAAEAVLPQAPPPAIEERVAAWSEADLEKIVERMVGAVVERLASQTLEKVAWEVVPDLAEALIREEIRQIKEKTV